jgi:hypothetical protein
MAALRSKNKGSTKPYCLWQRERPRPFSLESCPTPLVIVVAHHIKIQEYRWEAAFWCAFGNGELIPICESFLRR